LEAEIIVEGRRRRNWPKEVKRRIVEESYARDVSVCDVARRYDLDPAQLFAWRKAFRQRSTDLQLIPVAVDERERDTSDSEADAAGSAQERIEIVLGNGRRLLVPAEIDPKRLRRLLAAVDTP
jgi:transposase